MWRVPRRGSDPTLRSEEVAMESDKRLKLRLENIKNYFWSQVEIRYGEGNPCWNWLGNVNKKRHGYGYFAVRLGHRHFKNMAAHRFAYNTWHDTTLRSDQHLHHTCGKATCVNPTHLVITTAAMHPYLDTQRHTTTIEQVRRIRELSAMGRSRRSIAKELNMHPWKVSDIANRKIWAG